MMRKLVFIPLAICLVLTIFTTGISCSCNTKEGELPIYKTGNQWVYKTVINDVEYTHTLKVTGTDTIDNQEYYVITITIDPQLYGRYETGESWVDKNEPFFSSIKTQMEGTYEDMPASIVIQTSAEYPDGLPWPLEVGDEFGVAETSTIDTTYTGITVNDNQMGTITWKVEGKEKVKLSAGEFDCFVLKKYNEDGDLLITRWYSDKVKKYVKELVSASGDTKELQSYSIG